MADSKVSRQRRDELFSIGLIEHHRLRERTLSAYDISERLVPVQDAVYERYREVALDIASVMQINRSVTQALERPDGRFEREAEWQSLLEGIEDGGGFSEAPGQGSGWIFSALYWDHLTECQFATAWFFTDVLRLQYQFPRLELPTKDMGSFLWSLSGSGPPLYDGQTFFPDKYRRESSP